MLLQERGELAVKLGFNKENEMEIQGYYKPKGESFLEDEVLTAYVSASETKTWDNDPKAAALFQEFREKSTARGASKPSKYGVYTWNIAEGAMSGTTEVPEGRVP